MPLSDHEQKLLAQMEQALYQEDPKFATSLRGRSRGVGSVQRAIIALTSVGVGLTLIILGISLNLLWLSILGFVLMFGGVVFAVAAPAGRKERGTDGGGGGRRAPRPGGGRGPRRQSFVQRMEERWERRGDGGRQ